MNFYDLNFDSMDSAQPTTFGINPDAQMSLAEYMNANYADKGTGIAPLTTDQNNANLISHFTGGGKQNDWYLSAPDNHGKSGLGAILAMLA